MKIIVKSRGEVSEHEIDVKPLSVVVHEQGLKVETPDAEVLVTFDTTRKVMAEMSQRAWEHISTGPLFKTLYTAFFSAGADYPLPQTIKELNEDCDEGIVHICGMIVLLVESRFAGKKSVFIKNPEIHLHPAQTAHLVTVINMIQKIPLGGSNGVETQSGG